MRHSTLFAGAACVFISSTPVWAQSSDGEDRILRLAPVAVGGLRPVDEDDLTASVDTLDLDDLEVRSSPFVVDQLRQVPGVGVSRSGALGGLTQVRIRGAEANHTLVLFDGYEIADPITGETDFGLWANVGAAEIEVARGEQSALFGSDAIGGVVAITSADQDLAGFIEGGSRDTISGRLSGGRSFGAGRITGAIAGFTTEGVDTAGLGGEKDGSEDLSGLLRGTYDFGAFDLSTLARYANGRAETDPDLNFDGVLDNADRATESESWLFGATLKGETGQVDHLLRASRTDVRREFETDGAVVDETVGKRTKVSYSPSTEIPAGQGALRISGLGEFEREEYERRSTNTLFGDPNQIQSLNIYSVAGDALYTQGKFTLSGSLRFDHNDDLFDDAVTWRAGAAYAFDYGGRLRASGGRGVKNPTFTELFGFFPGSFIGNPELEPETSTSWEVGYDYANDTVSASLTYFQAELDDEIFTQFNPDFTSSPANRTGESDRRGVEASVRIALDHGLSVGGAGSYVDSDDDQDTDEIRVPQWTGSLSLDWAAPQFDGLKAGLAVDYVGSQDDFNFGTFPAQRVSLDSYVLVAVTTEVPINERLAITFRGENIFDEDQEDVFGFNQPGGGVFFGLKLR
ncbi:MAG: TonB-dependent receptor [Pseudomonadota bacterium]